MQPLVSPLQQILDYVLQLHDSGLSMSTLKVNLAAISAFHESVQSFSIFFPHQTTKRFLKGLTNIHPPHRPPPPAWSLDLVLHTIIRPPFEPLASISLQMLTMKVVFLLTITSAHSQQARGINGKSSLHILFKGHSDIAPTSGIYPQS